MSITTLIVAVRTTGAASLARLGAGFTAVAARARAAGRSVATSLGPSLTSALTRAGRRLQRFGSDVLKVTGEVIGAFAKWGSIGSLIVSLIPAVVDLSGLIGLLPPAILAAASSLLVLKLAFTGVGGAIKAALGGKETWKEWDRTHKDFSRNARSFAYAFALIANSWKGLRRVIQDKFFANLGAELVKLNIAHFPTMARWLPRISELFNQALTSLIQFLRAPEQVALVEGIFRNLNGVIQGLLGTLKPLTQIFLDVAAAAAPRLAEMSQNFADSLQRIADKVRELRENGKLGDWVDRARDAFRTLRLIIGDLAGVIGAFYQGATEDGKTFLEAIREQTKALNEWAHSTDGQSAAEAIAAIGAALLGVGAIVGALATFFKEAFLGIMWIAVTVFGTILDAAAAAFGWIPGLGPKLQNAAAQFGDFRDRVNALIAGIEDRDIHIKFKVTAEISKGAAQFADALSGAAKQQGGSRIQLRASGGPVRKGQPYVVGDGGRPELFVPDQDGYIQPRVPRAAMAASGSGGAAPMRAQLTLTGSRGTGLDGMFRKWLDDMFVSGRVKYQIINGRVRPV